MHDVGTKRAYAKIVGPGWIHYMMNPQCIMGRGPSVSDIALLGDPSISRKHVSIDFSPEYQKFEIKVLGLNGIFVNGDFLCKGDRPRTIYSHTDIIIGRENPFLITFYLPCQDNTSNKAGDSGNVKNKKKSDEVGMVVLVGTILIHSDIPLTPDEIYQRLLKTRVRLLETLGSPSVIMSSIRGVIMGNPHMFETVSAYDMTKRAEVVGENRVYNLAGFTI